MMDEDDLILEEDGSVIIEDMMSVEVDETDFYENLAEKLPETLMIQVAEELYESVTRDKESRKKRDEQYEEGLRRTGLGDDAPGGAEFDGASRVVHPVLAEACVDFSSRAIRELFPAQGPVKTSVIGEATPQKLERAERKKRFMNWQLTSQIGEYRAELEQLLTQLPMGGSQYQKFWYDEKLGRPRTEFVPIDDIYLPYSASDFYTTPRLTHRQLISRSEFQSRVKSGLYRDVFLPDFNNPPEPSASEQANDKIEGREEDGYNEDGLREVWEVQVDWAFEEDTFSAGEPAPYILTIDEDTHKVLSIYRNWKESDARFRKLHWIVEWKFIPWRGAYAIGLPHLIGGLSAALTGSLRALLDSAHINNAASMLKLKSGRVVGQNTQVNVTQVTEIEGPAGIDDIRKLAMPMPFNPPSPVLLELMGQIYGLAKGVVASSNDALQNVGDRTPVGTTMALIEQGAPTYSAIHARLHESQRKSLEILHRINEDFLDPDQVAEDLGEALITAEDFQGSLDVLPVSDPTIFSEAQRFAQVQSIVQMAQDPSVPWNKVNIYRRALKQMRVEAIDELLPSAKDPITEEPLAENFLAIQEGQAIKVGPDQDHLSHAQMHLSHILAPWVLQNPFVPPQPLLSILGHINEHLMYFYSGQLATAIGELSAQGLPPDQAMMMATQQLGPMWQQQIMPLLQQMQQAQQALQQRMPPPQLPPEVQASIQIAQMDTQRKAQADQVAAQLRQAQMQADQQESQVEMFLKQQQAQFDQFMAQQELQLKHLAQQVEIMKNDADNRQKQLTELLKNKDDNDTQLIIKSQEGDRQLVESVIQAKLASDNSLDKG